MLSKDFPIQIAVYPPYDVREDNDEYGPTWMALFIDSDEAYAFARKTMEFDADPFVIDVRVDPEQFVDGIIETLINAPHDYLAELHEKGLCGDWSKPWCDAATYRRSFYMTDEELS